MNADFDPSRVGDGALTLLRSMVESDIKRDGMTSSTMVRAGLLLDLIDEVQRNRAASVDRDAKQARFIGSAVAVEDGQTPEGTRP